MYYVTFNLSKLDGIEFVSIKREPVFIVKCETEMRSLVVLSRNRWIDHRHCSFAE